MTTKEIQASICKHEVLKFNLPCENVSWLLLWESDVLSLNKSGYLTEFETKISRSDFLADRKKSKWKYMDNGQQKGTPNYFVYACPTGLISVSEIPQYSGLIYVGEAVEIIKRPSLRHKFIHDRDKVLTKFSRVMSERLYLGSCRMTYDNKLSKELFDKLEVR